MHHYALGMSVHPHTPTKGMGRGEGGAKLALFLAKYNPTKLLVKGEGVPKNRGHARSN